MLVGIVVNHLEILNGGDWKLGERGCALFDTRDDGVFVEFKKCGMGGTVGGESVERGGSGDDGFF